jgi:Glycosyl transferases group 1
MSTVHFVHGGTAYLPELAAYAEHLKTLGHASQIHRSANTIPENAPLVWWICGTIDQQQTRRLAHSLHVHEYASASVGRLPWIKDRIKQWTHPRPHHRIFQSEWLRQRMRLTDTVPYSLRDMGVPPYFLTTPSTSESEFDLVYLGVMSRLNAFWNTLQSIDQAGLSLLLIGDVPVELQAKLDTLKNIQCTGRIAQTEVPSQLMRAKAGLNLMPPIQPLIGQTSTKMLEYLATGLPVISNDYEWARHASLQHPNRIQFIRIPSSPVQWRQIAEKVPAKQTDRTHLNYMNWAQQLQNLPVWKLLPSG